MFIAVFVIEIILRVCIPYYVRPPYLQRVFEITPNVMPGLVGIKNYSINSLGVRGDEIEKPYDHYVIAIGGSTTECLSLDDNETWPYLIQKMLNEKGKHVWVGNAGKSGAKIQEHVEDLPQLIKQFPQVKTVVILVGVNEVYAILRNTLEQNSSFNFSIPEFLKNLFVWKQIQTFSRKYFTQVHLNQENTADYYKLVRENRRRSSKVDTAPDFSNYLIQYQASIRQLNEICTENAVRCIFLTQPTMWRENLNSEEDSLLWFGWGGYDQMTSGKYYSVEVLSKVMSKLNDALLRECKNQKLECIDLANLLEKDTTTFYDDCHFNISGSLKVAKILSGYLINP